MHIAQLRSKRAINIVLVVVFKEQFKALPTSPSFFVKEKGLKSVTVNFDIQLDYHKCVMGLKRALPEKKTWYD